MLDFDETEHPPFFAVPEGKSSPFNLPKKKGIVQPPEIDPALRMKWGLALLGEERAKEYLAWLRKWLGEVR